MKKVVVPFVMLIGLSFYNKKDYQTAAGVLASVSGPSSDVSIYLAICYLALKDTGKARKSLDNAEKVGNASLEALGDLGTLEANLGDYDKALRDLIAREAGKRLIALGGTMPTATAGRRRRSERVR